MSVQQSTEKREKHMPNNLAALRTKHRFSRSQLADRVGVTSLTLGRWERGEAAARNYNLEINCVRSLSALRRILLFPHKHWLLLLHHLIWHLSMTQSFR